MRYRALDSNGDMLFGQGAANFLVNTPNCVAQAVLTKLRLMAGEWFLDINEGTPYSTQILGKSPQVKGVLAASLRDRAIRDRILSTPGVLKIVNYSSQLDPRTRAFTVSTTITTIYGSTDIAAVFPLGAPPPGPVAPPGGPLPTYAVTDTGAIGVTDTGQAITV